MTGRTKILAALLGILVMVPCGCWGRRELEDTALIVMIGLDAVRGPSGEPLPVSEAGLEVAAGIAVPRVLSGGPTAQGGTSGRGQAPPMLIKKTKAQDVTSATYAFEQMIDRPITTVQMQVLLVGEELARLGLDEVLDHFTRYRNYRHTIPVAVTVGRAGDFMEEAFPSMEPAPWLSTREIILRTVVGTITEQVNLYDLLVSRNSDSKDAALPLLRVHQEVAPGAGGKDETDSSSGSGITVVGTAVFKDATMVGTFDVTEATYALMLTGDFRVTFLTYPVAADGAQIQVGVRWEAVDVRRTVRLDGSRPRIVVKVRLEGLLTELPSGMDIISRQGHEDLERQIEEGVTFHCRRVIRKAQALGADIFSFGDKARWPFKTWGEWKSFNWPERFREADIQLDVTVGINRPGLTLRSVWFLD